MPQVQVYDFKLLLSMYVNAAVETHAYTTMHERYARLL